MTESSHRAPLPDVQLRVKALESLLTEKGVVNRETLDGIVDPLRKQGRAAYRRRYRSQGMDGS